MSKVLYSQIEEGRQIKLYVGGIAVLADVSGSPFVGTPRTHNPNHVQFVSIAMSRKIHWLLGHQIC